MTPSTFVSADPTPTEVDDLLDRIDRLLGNVGDSLPATRTSLGYSPRTITGGSTGDGALIAAAITPALHAVINAQLAAVAAAITPAIQAAMRNQAAIVAAAFGPALQSIARAQAALVASSIAPALDSMRLAIAASSLDPASSAMAPALTAANTESDPSHPARQQTSRTLSRSAHLERCLEDLQRWLGLGLNEVARAAGIDRGTVYAWRRRGSEPRPGTVGSVLRLHSLVASVAGAVGDDQARAWFHAGSPSPLARLIEAQGDHLVMSAIAREARQTITAPLIPPPNDLLAATADDEPPRSLI
jgi:hypothetical protein